MSLQHKIINTLVDNNLHLMKEKSKVAALLFWDSVSWVYTVYHISFFFSFATSLKLIIITLYALLSTGLDTFPDSVFLDKLKEL